MAHYNISSDPDLRVGKVAVQHVPCACQGCLTQLSLPWNSNIGPEEQPWYSAESNTCIYWPLFHGLNNWKIVSLAESGEMETLEGAKVAALGDIAT